MALRPQEYTFVTDYVEPPPSTPLDEYVVPITRPRPDDMMHAGGTPDFDEAGYAGGDPAGGYIDPKTGDYVSPVIELGLEYDPEPAGPDAPALASPHYGAIPLWVLLLVGVYFVADWAGSRI